MRRLGGRGAWLMLALLASCGRGEKIPIAPPREDLSPLIEAVYPGARSTGVLYDTGIWVRFADPLGPSSVNERTVFLKLDTVRIPVTITYDAATRTIRLAPRAALALRRTFTVEVSPGVATAEGRPLGRTYSWQFTTNGVRRPGDPIPASGTRDESPFALLQWTPTEPSAGTIAYEVYVGADSSAVAAKSAGLMHTRSQAYLLPPARWGLGARLHWSVTAVNRSTGERLEGPLWRFETLPAGFPVDSLDVPAADWGYYRHFTRQVICDAFTIVSGGANYNNGIHWTLRQNAGGLKLAGARLTVNATATGDLAPRRPAIHPVLEPWAPCTYSFDTPKVDTGTELARGVQLGSSRQLRYESDAFTAHLEANGRYGVVHGYSFQSASTLEYIAPGYGSLGPVLRLYYYRTPPARAVVATP